jgi:hypothetical protein
VELALIIRKLSVITITKQIEMKARIKESTILPPMCFHIEAIRWFSFLKNIPYTKINRKMQIPEALPMFNILLEIKGSENQVTPVIPIIDKSILKIVILPPV